MSGLELGLIGNGTVTGLLNAQGALVWFCNPRFDGDPVFCSLLRGDPDHPEPDGTFGIELDDLEASEQSYLPNTAILRTVQRSRSGAELEILDFCPRFKHYRRTFRPNTVVRLVRPLAGDPRVRIRTRPMSNYGADRCETTHGSNHIRFLGSPGGILRMTTNAPITALIEERPFVLTHEVAMVLGEDRPLPDAPLEVAQRYLHETTDHWHASVRTLSIPFEWQDAVIRAAITLKLSVFEDTGAIIAAPTTSIPEAAGTSRNWDYRYCWLRDGYFVVRALNRLSATAAMEELLGFITNVLAGIRNGADRGLQPVYGINWEANLDERDVSTLPGFRGMGPVRVGNAAYRQVQHDIYGGVVLALSQLVFDTRILSTHTDALLPRLEHAGRLAVETFGQPDAGIWELRGSARVHTSSSLMCWAACDRLARIAHHIGDAERARHWRAEADRMHETLAREAWSEEKQSFTATFNGETLDASLLLMFELGFLPPEHPKMLGTLAAVERELVKDGFVYRYTEADDFGEPENAFLLCAFWLVDALAAVGREDEAREMFEGLLERRNSLGLMAEHIDPRTGELWGNFPQTYSMAGIINCAQRLSKRWEDAF
ncbi:MAG: glycoside hydrolase family 15 protein [Gemmatimonadota bacterium]|nr:glycoside hydrolase family 15 protein [Gemmatimonadota bacterium]